MRLLVAERGDVGAHLRDDVPDEATDRALSPSKMRGTRAFLPATVNAPLSAMRYRMLLPSSTVRRKVIRGWD